MSDRPFIHLNRSVGEHIDTRKSTLVKSSTLTSTKSVQEDLNESMDQPGSECHLASSQKTRVMEDGSYKDTLEDSSTLRRKDRVWGLDSSGGLSTSSELFAEHIQPRVLNEGEVNTFSCVYQLHLSQHSSVWDGIARVNEEILLTMLDMFEKHECK